MTTSSYAAPEAAETHIIASTNPCPAGRRAKSTHIPRKGAPEGNRHSSHKIKRTRIHSLREPCLHPLGSRRRTPNTLTQSHKEPRHCLHADRYAKTRLVMQKHKSTITSKSHTSKEEREQSRKWRWSSRLYKLGAAGGNTTGPSPI